MDDTQDLDQSEHVPFERGVQRDAELDTSPERLWELLVDDDERAGWFGGPTTLEPVPGGAGVFTDPDGTVRYATVEEVDEARRLSWTWWPGDADGPPSRVDIDLAPVPGGTRISVTETPVAHAVPLLELESMVLHRSTALRRSLLVRA